MPTRAPADNENWLIDSGDDFIQKKATCGIESLSPVERLTCCLWVTDYSMRNAGDLMTAFDWYPDFQHEAATLASQLFLAFTHESFSLSGKALQEQYFQRFDRICNEVRGAER